MLKKIWIVIVSVTTLLLTGCNFDGEEYKTPDRQAKDLQSDIMKCFINQDKETLKSFFSEYVIDNYADIDTQIDEAFDFIDGEIVSYDEPFSRATGPMDEKSYGATTDNIITDKGTKYRIIFAGMLTDDENPDYVGVNSIKIINLTQADLPETDDTQEEAEPHIIYIGEDFI